MLINLSLLFMKSVIFKLKIIAYARRAPKPKESIHEGVRICIKSEAFERLLNKNKTILNTGPVKIISTIVLNRYFFGMKSIMKGQIT